MFMGPPRDRLTTKAVASCIALTVQMYSARRGTASCRQNYRRNPTYRTLVEDGTGLGFVVSQLYIYLLRFLSFTNLGMPQIN